MTNNWKTNLAGLLVIVIASMNILVIWFPQYTAKIIATTSTLHGLAASFGFISAKDANTKTDSGAI